MADERRAQPQPARIPAVRRTRRRRARSRRLFTPTGQGSRPQDAEAATFKPNAFVRIGADESVTVIANHSEMGQGIYTGLAMIVAEELDADWSKVRVEPAPADPIYNHTLYGAQITGGSTSTWTEWERLRKAGPRLGRCSLPRRPRCGAWRRRLVGERRPSFTTTSGRRASYGSLVDRASRLSPPKDIGARRIPGLQVDRQVDEAAGHSIES